MDSSIEKTARIPDDVLADKRTVLETYRQKLARQVKDSRYDVPEAALSVPFDERHLKDALAAKDALGPVSVVVLIGIGGPSVGTKAVYSALRTPSSPELIVLDILDHERIAFVIQKLTRVPLSEIAIVLASKSGTTTETLANADAFIGMLSARHGEKMYERVVCIGDPGTPLASFAETHKVPYVPMPKTVGGRYSVFTAIGLVPLLLLGIDVHSFVLGAREELTRAFADTETPHSSLTGASVLGLKLSSGMHTHLLFAEMPRLVGLATWYAQLFAESLGKTETRTGKPVRVGAAPIVLTPRELHSTAQLYFSRFPHTFTTFFAGTLQAAPDVAAREVGKVVPHAPQVPYGTIAPAIMGGVKAAFENEEMPYRTIDCGSLSAESLGAVMASLMLEAMYVAELFDINAFDQPHVELYKKETKRILGV